MDFDYSAYSHKWGLYSVNLGLEPELAYPDDLQKLQQLTPGGRLFYCEEVNGEYLALRYGHEVYRVKPDRFIVKPSPSYTFGQMLRRRKSNGRLEDGEIKEIIWHLKRDTHYYLIEVRGLLRRRWYFEEDLQPSNSK